MSNNARPSTAPRRTLSVVAALALSLPLLLAAGCSDDGSPPPDNIDASTPDIDASPTPVIDPTLRDQFMEQMTAFAEPVPDMNTNVVDDGILDSIQYETYTFESTATRSATGRIMTPENNTEPLPVIIAIHNTLGTDVLTVQYDSKTWVKDMVNHPDGHQFMVVAPTSPDFITGDPDSFRLYGEAMEEAYRNPGSRAPFLMDTVWDVHRLIDYLQTRPDVDPDRIGVVGFSKGGMEIQILAAVETRIAVAAPVIGVCSFKWGVDNDQWQGRADALVGAPINAAAEAGLPLDPDFMRDFYEKVSPGLLDKFDGTNMLPLIAPRPLIVLNGALDHRNPLTGVNVAIDAARYAYEQEGAEDRLSFVTENVGHSQPIFYDDAEAWLIRWLITEQSGQ